MMHGQQNVKSKDT